MNLKNFKIKYQLFIGLALLLAMVFTTGIIAFNHGQRIHEQTDLMYEHPFQVKSALRKLNLDIVSIQRDIRDLIIHNDQLRKHQNLMQITHLLEDAREQISIIGELYLGPKSDIDSLRSAFIAWNDKREETVLIIFDGDIETSMTSLKNYDENGIVALNLFNRIEIMERFAGNKSTELYENSSRIVQLLNIRLLIAVGVFLLFTAFIFNFLMYNIRKPLNELIAVTRSFHKGDYNARSMYFSKNEFRILSIAFNDLAESIQYHLKKNKKTETLERQMIREDDTRKFFQVVLTTLAEYTNSQIAAAYLLNRDNNLFEHYESIGTGSIARDSFSASLKEGEFGIALATREIHHITKISEDTRFVFQTVSGDFIPSEIITIPILAGNEAIAVLSLATTGEYDRMSLELLKESWVSLSVRIEGVLNYQRIKEIYEKIELQNKELEMQKKELISQSAMLIEQNTELEIQKKQLAEASMLKTHFLSNMSHELRTPLNSVIALTDVLNRRLAGKIKDEEYSYLEVISRNGKHLLSLINDILDISRIEAGKEEVEITKFNLVNNIAEIVSLIEPQAVQKKIALGFIPESQELPVISDYDKIGHILQNLIGNAVKFTGEGSVQVSAGQRDDQYEIRIKDTGIGIAESQIPIIFNEFTQADSGTSRRYGGTGLGLALARKYASLLGGIITVRSKLNEGSEFCLILPLEYSPGSNVAPPLTSSIREEKSEDSGGITPGGHDLPKTILLVEDSEPAIIQIQDFLEENGYSVIVARGGEEAISTVAYTIPDAMILDLMMPGIDGFEVLNTIRASEKTAAIPVLILTSKFVTKEELGFLKHNNIHQIIRKGDVNLEKLLDSIKKMVSPALKTVRQPIKIRKTDEVIPSILIVEDNPDNMIAVKAILADKYKVLEACDGDQAIGQASKKRPDLILMDIALPGMSGIEAFKIIRQDVQLQHIPIIALTASAMKADRETILAMGFDAYIAKPFEEKLLLHKIKELLYGV